MVLEIAQNRWSFAVLKPQLLENLQSHQKDLQRLVQPEALAAVVADRLAGRGRMGCFQLKGPKRCWKMQTGLEPQKDWELAPRKQAVGLLCRLHRHIGCSG